MNLVNLFKSLEKKKSKQHLWLIISNVMFLKEVLMLKTFFPLNNCSFDFSANLYSPSSATVRQFWFFSANERVHTPTHREQKNALQVLMACGFMSCSILVLWSDLVERERDREGSSSNLLQRNMSRRCHCQTTYFVGYFLLTRTLENGTSSRGMMLWIRTETWVLFQTLEPPNSINSNWQLDIVIKP